MGHKSDMAGAQIAVVIAAYNAEATLNRAVASALAQPETVEVCIVDDCSKDGTGALAAAWGVRDQRVRVLKNEANSGPGASRNTAIAATTAPWIAILDADDYLLPGRFGKLMRGADVDFVADELIRAAEGATPLEVTNSSPWSPLTFETFLLGNLGVLKGPLDLGFLKPVLRRAFIQEHGLRYRPDLRLGEDYEFYARALALGARFLVGGPAGYVSVERPGSLSKDHSEDDLLRLRDCDDDLRALKTYSRAELRALDRHWTSVDCRLQWRRLISAVKAKSLGGAIATFHTPNAALYLSARLGEQVWLRGTAALGLSPRD
ncbi:MAG: glycosyltransferase family 2 protein [Vitreimonas sp.]